MNLSGVLSNGVPAVGDLILDIEKGIQAGGGLAAEAEKVAEALLQDADFKAHIVALVSALKS